MAENNLPKTGKSAYVVLLTSFNRFFKHQSRILLKEIKTIKYATNYYRKYEDEYNDEKNNPLSLELSELEIIYDGIRYLEKKVDELLKQFDQGIFDRLIKNILYAADNSHIVILPIIDSKIKQFEDLFDELNYYKQSYFNLIDSKEFPYVPTPKFNKRFRNANLGLFLNKQLNDQTAKSYRDKVAKFYEVNNFANETDAVNFKNIKFFAKWGYSTDHYIKKFNSLNNIDKNQKNIYVSMSYAYLDKTIFHPIAFHEISHAMKHKEMSPSNNEYLEESIYTFKRKDIFKKNKPLDDLYKEILCDLSAVYATGYSYIMSLIHIGFFEFESLFLEYQESKPSNDVLKAEEEAEKLFKIVPNEDMVPKKFDFNINNISLAVRFLILIELCKRLNINNTYINGIEYMLKIIFPPIDTENKESEITFLTIYEFLSENASDYNQSRYLVYSLYEKFQNLILTRQLINNFTINKGDNESTEQIEKSIFEEFKTKIQTYNDDLRNILNPDHNVRCESIYDLLWLCREKPIGYNDDQEKKIRERDINRFFNIYSIFHDSIKSNIQLKKEFNNMFRRFFDSKESLFFNFEFIKYKSKKDFHPFVEFMKNQKYIPIQTCEEQPNRTPNKMSYIFAQYDIALLKETNHTLDLEIIFKDYPFMCYGKGQNEKNKYFIDRHSLFLLSEQEEENESKQGAFATVIQIKLTNMFFADDDVALLKELLGYFKTHESSFRKYRIFKSMGAEDYLIYVQGLNLSDTKKFGKNLMYDLKVETEIEDMILLEDPKQVNQEDWNEFEVISFAKINTKNSKAKEYFNSKKSSGFLPKKDFILIKTPTHRFDSIINWKTENNVLENIKNHLIETYYRENENSELNESIYSDFNIEIMHSIQNECYHK